MSGQTVAAVVVTGLLCEADFSRRLRMRRTSTKINPISVQTKLPNITKSGSIVSGPPPVIVMSVLVYPRAHRSAGRARFGSPITFRPARQEQISMNCTQNKASIHIFPA